MVRAPFTARQGLGVVLAMLGDHAHAVEASQSANSLMKARAIAQIATPIAELPLTSEQRADAPEIAQRALRRYGLGRPDQP